MDSTLLSAATPALVAGYGAGLSAGRLVLPAAVDAPAALVIAVDMPVAQETSALVAGLPQSVEATRPFAGHSSARTRTNSVPPPRGIPV